MSKREYNEKITSFHNIEGLTLRPEYPKNDLRLELSNVCNHTCLFCANRKMTRKKGFMDESFLRRILQEAHDEGFYGVGFYANGEPFISPHFTEYIRWAKEIGYTYVYIDTNGAAVGTEKIKEAIDAGLDSIKFSINGTDRETYELIHGRDDFDRVMENLKYAYQYKKELGRPLNVFVSIAVTKYIEDSVDAFVESCKAYCDDIVTNTVIDMGGYVPKEHKYLATGRDTDFAPSMKIPCYVMWNSLFITWEGYATACCADFQNYFVYADLNQTSIKEAWHNEKITELRKRHLNGDIEGMPCKACALGKLEHWIPLTEDYATMCDASIFEEYDASERIRRYEQKREETGK